MIHKDGFGCVRVKRGFSAGKESVEDIVETRNKVRVYIKQRVFRGVEIVAG